MAEQIAVIKVSELRSLVRSEVAAAIAPISKEDSAMTIVDAARYLRVSTETVRRKLRDHSIRGKRVGRNWRIMRSALDEYTRG